jgi:hypothetical protein
MTAVVVRAKQTDGAARRDRKAAPQPRSHATTAAAALPVYKTVLIPSVGWPTEAMVLASPKRSAGKR